MSGPSFSRDPRTMTAEEVWAELDASPGFRESMAQSEADIAAGRFYSWETIDGKRWSVPNPDWPKDGPQPHAARLVR